jgi:hypothetical protein
VSNIVSLTDRRRKTNTSKKEETHFKGAQPIERDFRNASPPTQICNIGTLKKAIETARLYFRETQQSHDALIQAPATQQKNLLSRRRKSLVLSFSMADIRITDNDRPLKKAEIKHHQSNIETALSRYQKKLESSKLLYGDGSSPQEKPRPSK